MSNDFAAALAKMRSDFLAELPGRCDKIEDSIMALEQGAPDAFDELFRQIHSLKGSGGTFGLQSITSICHDFETFITRARSSFGTTAANYSLNYLDLLRRAGGQDGPEAMRDQTLNEALTKLSAACMPRQPRGMVVESSAAGRMMIKAGFSDLPIELTVLDNGLSALALLEAEPFDVLICSGEMGDIPAVDLIGLLRGSPGTNGKIPVILVSSNPFPDHARLGLSAVVKRDPKLIDNLAIYVGKLLGWKAAA